MKFDVWLKSIPASPATGWRWRREGLIKTVNVFGRVYVTDEAIRDFIARAEAGQFAQEHKVPEPHAHAA